MYSDNRLFFLAVAIFSYFPKIMQHLSVKINLHFYFLALTSICESRPAVNTKVKNRDGEDLIVMGVSSESPRSPPPPG